MDESAGRRRWLGAMLLAGVAYLLIGWGFAVPSSHVEAWRRAAWLASAIVFAVHIWYEHYRRRSAPPVTARHVALAVAIGAFGLAVIGAVHSLATPAGLRPVWGLALVAWPAVTAIPAFLVALAAAAALTRLSAGAGGGGRAQDTQDDVGPSASMRNRR